jgi:hypothetical protein
VSPLSNQKRILLDQQEISIDQLLGSIDRTALIRFDQAYPISLLRADRRQKDEVDALYDEANNLFGSCRYLQSGMQSVLLLDCIAQYCSDIAADAVQQASDDFREQLKLTSSQQTMLWLDTNGISLDHWSDCVATALALEEMKKNLFADRVESWFGQNSRSLDRVELSRLTVNTVGIAEEIIDQINEGEICFAEAVERHDISTVSKKRGGYWGIKGRKQVDHAIEVRLFDAEPGDIVGPLENSEGAQVFRVLDNVKAALNAENRRQILTHLFTEWWSNQRTRIKLIG